VPCAYIQKYLSQKRKRTIFYSVAFGFLMSACCHGILAISMSIYKKGASTSSVVAFLLASPWANLPLTVLLFGFFGFKAFFIVVSAIIIAINTGLIFQVLERRGLIENNSQPVETKTDFSIRKDAAMRLRGYRFTASNVKESIVGVAQGSWFLMKMVL